MKTNGKQMGNKWETNAKQLQNNCKTNAKQLQNNCKTIESNLKVFPMIGFVTFRCFCEFCGSDSYIDVSSDKSQRYESYHKIEMDSIFEFSPLKD